jgi:hypothetical protein
MGFEVFLILLVPLGVWILSSVFKSEDERPGSRQGNGSRPTAQRRPVTDLERFLEEARRRRESADKRQQPEGEAPARPAPSREVRPSSGSERRPARTPPPPPQPRRRQVEGPAPRSNRPPVLLEAVPDSSTVVLTPRIEPPRPEPRRVEPLRPLPAEPSRSMPVPAPTPVVSAAPPLPPAPPVAGSRTAPPPAVAQLVELLRSPRSAATAIILREVFDQPLCRRRR